MEARTPIRMPRDERRRQIVRIAGELFAERGYHGASMSELARRAGISKPVIYDLVGSKEDVYRASCEEVAMEVGVALMTAVQQADTPEGRIRAVTLEALKLAAKHERAAAVLFSKDGAQFADAQDFLRRQRGELITSLLEAEAARRGVGFDHLQVEATAHMLGGAFEALALWWSEHHELPPETLVDWFVSLTLSGVERLEAP